MQSDNPQTIDIWKVRTAGCSIPWQEVDRLLSPDELERATRFRFEMDRNRYVAAHIALHRIIRRYLASGHEPVSLLTMPNGKPFIEPRLNPSGISFNLSHSGDFALVAVTQNVDIGVDIEKHREVEYAGISRRFFTPAECRWIEAHAEPLRMQGFFRLWSAKEAYLKAVGTGLAAPLNEVQVQFGRDQQLQFESTRPGVLITAAGRELNVAPDYAAAVVLITGKPAITINIRHFGFEDDSATN